MSVISQEFQSNSLIPVLQHPHTESTQYQKKRKEKKIVIAGLTANTENSALTVFLCSSHGNPTMRRPPPHHVPWFHISVSAARIRQSPARMPRRPEVTSTDIHITVHTWALTREDSKHGMSAPLAAFNRFSVRPPPPPPPPHGTLPVKSHRCQLRRQSSPDLWPADTLLMRTSPFGHAGRSGRRRDITHLHDSVPYWRSLFWIRAEPQMIHRLAEYLLKILWLFLSFFFMQRAKLFYQIWGLGFFFSLE